MTLSNRDKLSNTGRGVKVRQPLEEDLRNSNFGRLVARRDIVSSDSYKALFGVQLLFLLWCSSPFLGDAIAQQTPIITCELEYYKFPSEEVYSEYQAMWERHNKETTRMLEALNVPENKGSDGKFTDQTMTRFNQIRKGQATDLSRRIEQVIAKHSLSRQTALRFAVPAGKITNVKASTKEGEMSIDVFVEPAQMGNSNTFNGWFSAPPNASKRLATIFSVSGSTRAGDPKNQIRFFASAESRSYSARNLSLVTNSDGTVFSADRILLRWNCVKS